MRWLAFVTLVLAVAGGAGLMLTGCGRNQGSSAAEGATQSKTLYTCGMHPQVVQPTPGNCPICGMKLTPIRQQGQTAQSGPAAPTGERKIKYYKSTMTPGEVRQTPGKDAMGMEMVPVYEDEAAAASQTIAIDPVTIQNMGIRTAMVASGPLRRTIRTVGVVEFSETALSDVTTKFKGWIEKLYVDTTGQQVHQGEPLFEIYSPDLYVAEMEYVLALAQAGKIGERSADALKISALTKLKYFDISDDQVAELEKNRQVKKTLRVNAPRDGIVVEKMAVAGQMADAGMKLYRVADLGTVWIQAQIYEQDLAFVKLGQEALVSLAYLPDRQYRGRVTYVYPTVDEKTRTAKVRMEFHNPGFFLKPGMFSTVALTVELEPSVLLVPDMAILRSGEKNTAFVALDGGKFEPRTLTLGPQAENDLYQVISGLKEGERIVTSGQFMLDSESQLREAIQKMLEPKQANPAALTAVPSSPGATAHTGHENMPMPAATASDEAKTTKYICPMPEHVSIQYDHSGTCAICGMALVPVSGATLKKLQPGGKLLYYTCPMPEHSDVHSEKPGKCPKCGMTLIPIMEAPLQVSTLTNQAGANKTSAMPLILYTCPMASHADVVSDKPGKCPKCEMELVETGKVGHGKIAEQHWREKHAAHAPH